LESGRNQIIRILSSVNVLIWNSRNYTYTHWSWCLRYGFHCRFYPLQPLHFLE
jgi:hypothetical protein